MTSPFDPPCPDHHWAIRVLHLEPIPRRGGHRAREGSIGGEIKEVERRPRGRCDEHGCLGCHGFTPQLFSFRNGKGQRGIGSFMPRTISFTLAILALIGATTAQITLPSPPTQAPSPNQGFRANQAAPLPARPSQASPSSNSPPQQDAGLGRGAAGPTSRRQRPINLKRVAQRVALHRSRRTDRRRATAGQT
jgi:hypothetical protein